MALFLCQIHLSHVLRDLPRVRVRQIRERDYGQVIIHIPVDGRLETLPRTIVMDATVSRPLVNEPAKAIVTLVRLAVFLYSIVM